MEAERVAAPALAEIHRMVAMRAPWLKDQPFAVHPELWQRGSTEINQIMRDRGWYVPTASIDQPNFLLYGIPIVMAS